MDQRFLIIARVSDQSQHGTWLQGEDPAFDLFLSYSGNKENAFKNEATFYEHNPSTCEHSPSTESPSPESLNGESLSGESFNREFPCSDGSTQAHWATLAVLVEQYWELISTYEVIGFANEAVHTNSSTLNTLFSLFAGHQLALAQPAMCPNSYFEQPLFLQRNKALMRFTDQTETLFPLMSRQILAQLHPTLGAYTTAHQLARAWAKQIDNPCGHKIAIIDAAPVTVKPALYTGASYSKKIQRSAPLVYNTLTSKPTANRTIARWRGFWQSLILGVKAKF